MKHDSIKDLVNTYLEYFFPLKDRECPFFTAADMLELTDLSAGEIEGDKLNDDFLFLLTTYGLMAGFVKGYKQALKDQKKGISRIDRKSKYAGKDVEPSEVAQEEIEKRIAKMEAARTVKVAKREAKNAEKANKSPMSTSKNPTEKKTAAKKCGTVAKKTAAKKSGDAAKKTVTIVVCKEYQNQHIGRRCVEDMLKLANEKGMDTVKANIYSFNEQSRRMFEAVGFKKIDEEWYRRKCRS